MKQGSFIQAGTEEVTEQLLINNSLSDFTGDEGQNQSDQNTTKQSNIEESDYSTRRLAKGMIKCSLPCMIQFFSALFVNNTTIHYISLKDDINLYNGMSLAMNLLNCFSFYVIFHSNIGFNAAASQAIGAGNKKLVGFYLHRAFIIHLLFNLFAYGLLCVAPSVFALAGIDENFTKIAFEYLVMIPGYILGVIIFDTLKNYLYVNKIFTPLVVIQSIIAVSYWFLADYLFIKQDLHLKGMVIAITACQFFGVLLLILYLIIRKPHQIQKSWFGLRKESFKDLWHLCKIMIGVGGMGYVEVFAYRIQSFFSMSFAPEQTAALTAFLAFGDLFYVLPVGASFPTITYIGKAMGSRNKKGVMKVLKVTFSFSIVVLIILLGVFTVFKENFFSFYNKNPDVHAVMDKIGLLYYFSFPADFFQTVFAGIIKGAGKEKVGTKSFLLALYLVGVPLSFLFAFKFGMEAPGMWLGNGIGLYAATFSFVWIILRIDYEKQFEAIIKRNARGANALDDEA